MSIVAHLNLLHSSYMNLIIIISLLIVSSLGQSDNSLPNFADYIVHFNKTYDNAQYHQRQLIYNYNLQYIKQSNCTAIGVNIFTDWSLQEMKKLKGGYQANIPHQQTIQAFSIEGAGLYLTNKTTPLSYDWRDYNAVTSIKNQGNCGSCWAYSTTAFFQSDLIISNNYTNQIDLSEQFLLKCDNRSLKCDGGFLFWAMQRVIEDYSGMPTQRQYPYNYSNLWNQNEMCYQSDLIKIDQNRKLVSFYEIQDATFIQRLLLKKPVNVNLCSKDFQFYAPKNDSRILYCSSGQTNRDHTVLLIGYTQTQWIIKNQWSTNWGVDGYGYISKQSSNDCCIGKQLFTTGTISTQCQVANCQICVEQTSCFSCNAGYYVKNVNSIHTCQKCMKTNCLKCVNYYGVCDTCADGYSVTYPSYNCALSAVQHCTFMYNDECMQCFEGYVLDVQGNCTSKLNLCYRNNCKQCVSLKPNVCKVCNSGFLLNNASFQCQQVIGCNIANCTKCSSNNSNFCQVCALQNYFFSSSQKQCIVSCLIQKCSTCSNQNSNICLQCDSGYTLSTDNKTCKKCTIKYCANCLTDPFKCDACFVGFYFKESTVKCQTCSSILHCIQCNQNVNSSQINCIKCASGYTVSPDGLLCLKCLGTCVNCVYSNLAACVLNCGLTNYLQNNICQSCSQNCIACLNSSSCTKCLSGYTVQNGYCYPNCQQGSECIECNYGVNSSKCLKYQLGYISINGSTLINQSYSCLEQNGQNPPDCQSCPQKYYLRSVFQRKICTKCSTIDPNCLNCFSYSPSSCANCAESYYLVKSNSTCVKCSDFDSNCIKCTDNNQCTSCKNGFYLLSVEQNDQSSGVCQACSPQCQTCKYNFQFCLSCKTGYLLSISKRCVRNVRIKFTIVLDAQFDQVLNELLVQIYEFLANMWKLDSKYIEIAQVIKGSIQLSGNIYMPQSQTDQDLFLSNVRSSLQSSSSIATYNILSTNTQLVIDSGSTDVVKRIEQNDLTTPMIIGIAVGGGVFTITLIVVMIFVAKKVICKKPIEKQEAINKVQKKQELPNSKSFKTVKSTQPSIDKNDDSLNKKDQTDKYIHQQCAQINANLGYPIVV